MPNKYDSNIDITDDIISPIASLCGLFDAANTALDVHQIELVIIISMNKYHK